MRPNTVIISIEEYDKFRDYQEQLSKKQIVCYYIYPNYHREYFTENEFIKQLSETIKKLVQENDDLKQKIDNLNKNKPIATIKRKSFFNKLFNKQ